jgi:integrase/recombinase XerD
MLERYYVRPDSVDRIRSAWIGASIEKYVEWLARQGYAARTVLRRAPLLMEFGEFARQRGVTTLEELPSQVEAFALHWLEKHGQGCKTDQARAKVKEEARNPCTKCWLWSFRGFRIRVGRERSSHFKTQSQVFLIT